MMAAPAFHEVVGFAFNRRAADGLESWAVHVERTASKADRSSDVTQDRGGKWSESGGA